MNRPRTAHDVAYIPHTYVNPDETPLELQCLKRGPRAHWLSLQLKSLDKPHPLTLLFLWHFWECWWKRMSSGLPRLKFKSCTTTYWPQGLFRRLNFCQPRMIAPSQGTLGNVWRLFCSSQLEVAGCNWHPVGKRPVMLRCAHRTSPTAENYLAQDGSSAKVKRPWFKVRKINSLHADIQTYFYKKEHFPNEEQLVRKVVLFWTLQISPVSGLIEESQILVFTTAFNLLHYHIR